MAVDEIIDWLYGLPLGEFTRARDQAAGELRKAGDREGAALVKALRKPTVAAAAVNRLVREHRGEVETFLRVAASLREAQFAGKGDVASATQREREALGQLIRLGGDAVRQTVLAAAVDEDAARELLEGRLVRELEPRGFGTLLAHSKLPARKPVTAKRVPPEPKKPDDRVARAKLRVANEAVTAAEAQEQQAKRHWAQTKRELEKARSAAETAQRDLDRLHRR